MVPPEDQPDALEADSVLSPLSHEVAPLDLDFMPAPKKIRKPDAEEIVLRVMIRALQNAQKSPRPDVAEVAYNYEKYFQTKLHKLLASHKT